MKGLFKTDGMSGTQAHDLRHLHQNNINPTKGLFLREDSFERRLIPKLTVKSPVG